MNIGGKFGSAVFEPLYEHLCKGRHCSDSICNLIDAFIAMDKEEMQKLHNEICETESQADQIKLAIRTSLTKSIFAAVKRNDVLQIVKCQDRICDRAEDVSKLMVVRETNVPGGCADALKNLAEKVDETVSALLNCCGKLAMVPGTDAEKATNLETLLSELDEIHEMEEVTDNLVQEFTKELLARERESDPLSIILLLEMARLIAAVADEAENAAEAYTSLLGH